MTKTTRAGPAATLILALIGLRGAAAEPPAITEDPFLTEMPAVLTVTRLSQPQSETPAAVTVIDRDMIRASGARRVAELFRLVPGFLVGHNHGTQPVVTYQGLSDDFPRRLQVLIDGRSVYSAALAGVFWNDLPLALEDIERIEVIRGPNAASYGSNAFSGVINIITRHASQTPERYVGVAAGQHEIVDGTVRQRWSDERYDTRLTAGYRHDDGLDGLPDTSRVPFARLRSDIRLNGSDTLELHLGATGGTREDGHYNDLVDPPHERRVTGHFEQVRWRRALEAGEEVSVHLYHNYWRNDEDYLTEPLALGPPLGAVRVPVELDLTEQRYEVELQHVSSPFQDWRFVWGTGARLDRARSDSAFGTSDTLENRIYRLFGNAEWRATSRLVANAGLMIEDSDHSDTELSPRLALNYHLTPRYTVRASVSRATRLPTLIEERGNEEFRFRGVLLDRRIVAGGGLQPESLESFEIGYLGRWPDANLTVDARLYRDHVDDFITALELPAADLDGEERDYRNEGEARINGVELEINYEPTRATRLVLGTAFMDATVTGLSPQATENAQAVERSVPDFTASLLAMHRLSPRWDASASYYRVGDIQWLGSGNFVENHGRLDLRLARGLDLSGSDGELALVIQNVGPDYTDFDEEQRFDTRGFVTVSLSHP